MSAARLAMVVPDLAIGGLQAMAVGLLEALDRTEFEPVVYSFDAGGPLEGRLAEIGVSHVHMPRGEGISPGYARLMGRRFVEDRIQLVHCHNVTALFHGARAAWRAGHLPSLFTEHDREMPAPWKHRVLHRWLARRVTRTVAVSAGLADDLVRYEGFPRQRTERLVNGIPDPRADYAGDRTGARADLGWDDVPVVLAVGSLTTVKNHAGLLRAHGHLLAGGARARLVIAGDGPLRAELESQARQLPAEAVQFLGNRNDVPRLLAAADVFVLPSHREGLPLSLVEAHAMSRPSVAYHVGGNGEVIVHGETGLLVPHGDEQGLASALGGLLADEDKALALGTAARSRFTTAFTHERMVSAYVELYRELLSGRYD